MHLNRRRLRRALAVVSPVLTAAAALLEPDAERLAAVAAALAVAVGELRAALRR